MQVRRARGKRPSVLIFHRSSLVILLGRFLCVLGPFFGSVQQHVKKLQVFVGDIWTRN